MVKVILEGIEYKDYQENILISDENFFVGKSTIELKKMGYQIKTKKSEIIPGLQIADIISGVFRKYDNGYFTLLDIIHNRLCEKSRKYLRPKR